LKRGDSRISSDRLESLLTARLLSFDETLRGLQEDVRAVQLPLHARDATELLATVIDEIRKELPDKAEELRELSGAEEKSRRSVVLNYALERFMSFVYTLVQGTRNLPSAFFQFIEMMEESLPRDWRFGFLVGSERELGTVRLNEFLGKILDPFVGASQYLSLEPRRWLFLVPPSVMDNPLSWVLLSHEVGHVLELSQLKVVLDLYGPIEKVPSSYETTQLRYRHSEEYQADFFASYFFGPCFVKRLLLTHYTRETYVSPSHPSWEERVKALLDRGISKLPTPKIYRSFVQNALEGIKMGAGAVPGDIVDLESLFDKTLNGIRGNLNAFDCESAEFGVARARLADFSPYTNDYILLLNAAVLEEERALSAYTERGLGPPDRADREFRYLVLDSLRLCYVRMHYLRRARTEKAAREASEELAKSSLERAA